jgi:adenylate kinase
VRLVLLGPPGAGKGTQAEHIAAAFDIPHIATGDIFRDNVRQGTPLGQEAKGYMDRGELVPDDVVIGMVDDRLTAGDAEKGFLLDGFPRTVPQAEALEELLAKRDMPLGAVVRFLVDDEVVVDRISRRRTCPACNAVYHIEASPPAAAGVCDECGSELTQRADDSAEVVLRRLEEYRSKTQPLEAFYAERGLLRDIDAVGSVEEISRRALELLHDLDKGGGAA